MIEPLKFTVELTSDRFEGTIVDLSPSVTDIDIYENLEVPFLTARMAILDEMNFYERTDILGGERIKIKLKSLKGTILENPPPLKEVVKDFYISQVDTTIRRQDQRGQVVVFHLIEDVGYESVLQNINKLYKGKCSNIIKKILSNYLGKEIISEDNDIQQIKTIIPNLSPLNASIWLKNRATTSDGYPFYLYSTLVDKELYFQDLGTLLSKPPVNGNEETAPSVKLSAAAMNSIDNIHAYMTMSNYEHKNIENMLDLIGRGLIGGNHDFINSSGTNISVSQNVNFDIYLDLISKDSFRGLFNKDQKNALYNTHYNYNGTPFNKLKSRTITQFGGSNSQRTTKSKVYDLSYSEGLDKAAYKSIAISKAMSGLATKSPLTITMNGLDFLDGLHHNTIGRKIVLDFLSTDFLARDMEHLRDSKFSGEYLIHSAKHIIRRERYDVKLLTLRLSNRTIKEVSGTPPPNPTQGAGAI